MHTHPTLHSLLFQNIVHICFQCVRGIHVLDSACSWRQAAMPQHPGHDRHQKYNVVCAGSLGRMIYTETTRGIKSGIQAQSKGQASKRGLKQERALDMPASGQY